MATEHKGGALLSPHPGCSSNIIWQDDRLLRTKPGNLKQLPTFMPGLVGGGFVRVPTTIVCIVIYWGEWVRKLLDHAKIIILSKTIAVITIITMIIARSKNTLQSLQTQNLVSFRKVSVETGNSYRNHFVMRFHWPVTVGQQLSNTATRSHVWRPSINAD